MIRRAPETHRPSLPWPRPPKGIFESDLTHGVLPAKEQSWGYQAFLLIGGLFILAGIFMLGFYPGPMAFIALGIGLVLLGLTVLTLRSHTLTWNETGLTLNRFLRKPHVYGWQDVNRIVYRDPPPKPDYSYVTVGSQKENYDRNTFTIFFEGGQTFHFTTLSKRLEAVSFMIEAGRHIEDTEESELAKPVPIQSYSEDHFAQLEKKAKLSLRYAIAGSVIGVILMVVLPMFMSFQGGFLVAPIFTGWLASASIRSHIKNLRAWKKDSTFTDPDRPIELAMYEQYGDLAEPLARFFRQVWMYDARLSRRHFPALDQKEENNEGRIFDANDSSEDQV